jgi:glycosyltransferase involved in cell wall biosynthesis
VPDTNEPFVSIVTPFYNIEPYLAECIESVLAQTYSNWEYILLNNCSSDGSREIAQRYAALDRRIRLLDNDRFLSQVGNYNRALQQISPASRYTKMLEADNWLYKNCVAEMVAIAEAYPRVGVVGAYSITEKAIWFQALPRETCTVSGTELARLYMCEELYPFGAPTSIMLRSSIVRDRQPFFEEKVHAEDLIAYYDVLSDHDFAFVHQILTFIRTENESILSRLRPFTTVRGFNGSTVDRFVVIKRAGKRFLGASEYERAYRVAKERVHRQLALGVLAGHVGDYLAFHRTALRDVGEDVEWFRLAKHVGIEAARVLLNPGSLAAAMLRRLGWGVRTSSHADPRKSEVNRRA